jgi:hypothetical protein
VISATDNSRQIDNYLSSSIGKEVMIDRTSKEEVDKNGSTGQVTN